MVSILTICMQPDKFDFHQLLHSADLVEAQLRSRLKPLGIRPRQARILNAINRLGPVTQNHLACAFDISPASMSTMTTRLVAAGFLSRNANPRELRSNLLQLTNEGEELLQQIYDVWEEMDDFVEELIGLRAARSLSELTQRLLDELGGNPPAQYVELKD